MSETVLVTGAGGLIGAAVVAALAARGARVLALDRDAPAPAGEGVTSFAADLTDLPRLHAILARHPAACAIHCGAISGPMVATDNPFWICQANVLGTANLAEAARVHGLRRLVYCSTITAYGATGPGPVAEDHPLRPTNVYGATKAAGEHILAGYRHQHGVDGVALRIAWVFGPRRRTPCALRSAIRAGLRGEGIALAGPADFPRQYVHVDDVVRAILCARDATEVPRLAYNLTGESCLRLAEIRDLLQREFPASTVTLDEAADPGDDRQERFDTSAIRQELGFTPAISFEAGLEQYRRWLTRNDF